MPPVLKIQLKRQKFNDESKKIEKLNQEFEINQYLDLKKLLVFNQGVKTDSLKYHLYGIVIHSGTINSGHYWSYIKHSSVNNVWVEYNDCLITERSQSEVEFVARGTANSRFKFKNDKELIKQQFLNKTSAYLLFYYNEDIIKDIVRLPNKDSDASAEVKQFFEAERDIKDRLKRRIENQTRYRYIMGSITLRDWNSYGICPSNLDIHNVDCLQSNNFFHFKHPK